MNKYILLIQVIKKYVMWIIYFFCPFLVTKRNRINAVNNINAGKSVFFVPHADDELLGTGYYLLEHRLDSYLIFLSNTGSKKDVENRKKREQEFETFCRDNKIEFCYIDDNYRVESFLKDANNIFLPSLIDWHREHRDVNFVACALCDKYSISKVYWYNISVPLSYSESVVYYPGKIKFDKYRLFKVFYKSQTNIPVFRFKTKERIYGYECGVWKAEKCLELEFEHWKKII
ncbi:MAG: PIG-L family deacetylase, partial [Lachnospiraceae bacterium]|nr:PIG-L family deacetylase [Lachnospiraceae bacterium]